MDQIELRGLVVQGHIGAFEEERDRLQPLEIDLDVVLDLSVPGESDALEDTVDYGVLCDMVDRIVETERFALLERLATRVAEVALTDSRVDEVRVSVRKLEPPVPQALTTSGVTIVRGRRDR